MSFLSDAEITTMRNGLEATFPDTCTIQSIISTSDGAGGQTAGTAYVWGTVACRHDPQRAGNRETIAGAEGNVFDSIFVMPYSAPVAVNRQIIHNGITYQIRDLATDQSWQLCQKAYVAYLSEGN